MRSILAFPIVLSLVAYAGCSPSVDFIDDDSGSPEGDADSSQDGSSRFDLDAAGFRDTGMSNADAAHSDGGAEDGATSDSSVSDGGVADTGAPCSDGGCVSCAVIGNGEAQFGFGSYDCNQCARTYCCGVETACLAASPDGGVISADGGYSDCGNRFTCWATCLTDPDGIACNAQCDTQFSGATNATFNAAYACIYGGWDPGRAMPLGFVGGAQPASGSCRTYANGTEMCN